MGSGSWVRSNSKDTVDSQHAIDVRYLKKEGLLYAGKIGTLTWSRNGKETGSIGYRIEDAGIRLNYRSRLNRSDEWQDVQQFIAFDYTPCNYGGHRTWLKCPNCHKRVTCVYGANTYFLCRHCYGLNYRSQHENYFDRQLTKSHHIRMKLGGEPGALNPFPPKPKGMHWNTYSRLYLQTMAGERCHLQKMEQYLDKLSNFRNRGS